MPQNTAKVNEQNVRINIRYISVGMYWLALHYVSMRELVNNLT